MVIDGSSRKARRAITLAIIALVVAVGVLLAPVSQGQASTYKAAVAPINSHWTEYLEGKALGSVASRTVDGRPLGLMPSLLDPALTRGLQVESGLVGALPSSFDLRSSGRVSPVKNQSSFGTCWSFATYGSLESWLLTGELRDFSEDNLVLNSGYGTSTATAASLYDMGGNLQMSTGYLTRWGGPVNESSDAYGDSLTPAGLTALKHVQQVDWIPARASATDNTNIKNALMTVGAVYVSMYFAGSSSGSTYYKASTASYYYGSTSTSGNHAVTIVGWDDNYAASNFATNPGANGAFIVKNSWGTGWGSSGYFYVSYYDTCFGRVDELAAFDNAESTTNYTGIYQYDPLGCVTSMYYGSGSSGVGWFANVFTATSTATVRAIGFYAMYPGTTYEIYTGSTLAGKTLNTSGTASYMGYHTVTLTTPLSITQNQSFAIAVKVVTPSSVTGNKYPVAIEYPIENFSEKASAGTGQSYISTSGTSWIDMTSVYAGTNACIKAYTGSGGSTPTSYTLTTTIGTGAGSIARNPNQATYTAGTQVTLTATPADGYTFSGWSGGATGSTNPVVVTMDGNKTVTANFQSSGPVATRFEQSNTLLVYAGTWSTGSGSSYSGSSYKTTNSVGAKVTAAFTGTSVSYIARTAASFGIAKVTLDGVVYYADLYSATTKYKQTVWSKTDLAADVPHTLVIERNGTHTPPSTNYSVNLDALDIVGTLTAVTPAPVSYTLTTTIGTGAGSIARNPNQATYTAGTQVTLTATPADGYTFSGWSGGATGSTNPVLVTMDGNKTVTANFQSSGGPVTYTLTTTIGAGSGSITKNPNLSAYDSGASVQVTATPANGYVFTGWSGALTGSANPATVTMDGNKTVTASFALVSSAVTRYEQDNPFFVYSGTWSTASGTSFSGGSFAYTNYSGAKVTAKFIGTAVKYIARAGATSGKAKVTLDGVVYTVDLYNSGTAYKKAVWSATGLSSGTHTLTIEFMGTRNPLSSANTVNLDALDITGTLLAP